MAEKRPAISQTEGGDTDGAEQASAPQPGLLAICSGRKPVWLVLPVPLQRGEIELGRENLGAQLGDARISRNHARVCFRNGAFLAMDLGSRNGTVVDGRHVPPASHQPIERCLRIGETILIPVADITPLSSAAVSVKDSMVIGPRLHHAYQRIGRAASSSTTLHITGESGAGKENAARVYHAGSPASRGPFVAVNCATIPEGIAERLLFGARRGAFSGATSDVAGYIQTADGGTLFLDEIAELHPTVQAKLLRVLETREVLPLGALRPQPVTIQICSASHRSLYAEVAAGRLREDLYYRIGRPSERIPPLRERPEEIPWLIEQELQKQSRDLCAHASLVEACLLRPWPGNVRELLVEIRAAAQEALGSDTKKVKAEHLSPAAGLPIKDRDQQFPAAGAERAAAVASTSSPVQTNTGVDADADADSDADADADEPFSRSATERHGRAAIMSALFEAKGNLSGAARMLGLQRNQLRRLIEIHKIEVSKIRLVLKS